MSRNRKLEKEVAQTLKKIDEGVDVFDRLYEKVYQAEEKSHKQKYETDLKKEIKKLQRLRDQLKTWIQGSDLKEMQKLIQARKVIEQKMEQFKRCEKELKTKTYSKIGLAKAARNDTNSSSNSTRGWLCSQLDSLKSQVSKVEENIESLISASSKKKKKSSKSNQAEIDAQQQVVEQHGWHVQNLEKILFLLDEKKLQPADVETIRDDVDYYVTENSEPDFYDDQEIYVSLLQSVGGDKNDSKEKTSGAAAAVPPRSSFDDPLSNIGRGVSKKKAQDILEKIKSTPGKGQAPGSSGGASGQRGGAQSGPGDGSANKEQVARAQLKASFGQIPSAQDSTRSPSLMYQPRNPYPTPDAFPTAPATLFDNPAMFEKLDVDTLFFVFYFQQGTYQQHLASKQLKKRSWRYHKKYNTWFQRHEEPTVTTDDYEQGTYVYFDFEAGWCQRIKKDFRFDYMFLEDSSG
jgi:CCR4-NOT transcription complex subunit 3